VPDHLYVYPGYLVQGGSRAEGRRVPEALSVPELTLEAIVAAAVRLGYQAVAEPEKNYPRRAHEFGGRVKVTKRAGVPKTKFLRELAEELQRSPGPSGSP
jgi:signal recognition particle subunit SEC65